MYQAYKEWLRDEFTFRCVYCLVRERWFEDGEAAFSVEHLIPQSLSPTKALDYENLLYACLHCNSLKRDLSPFPDPCAGAYGVHLQVNDDGVVNPLTVQGNIVIETLQLNEARRVEYRSRKLKLFRWLRDNLADQKTALLFKSYFGFPDNLPNLKRMKPPRNRRPKGVNSCYYVLRKRGKLPQFY